MSKIPGSLNHSRETYLYSLAFTFERSAYYGIRGLIVLYMFNNFQLTEVKAYGIYGLIGTGGLGAMILGGLLGDLITGNRRALILGAVLQFLGAVFLCFNSLFSLYIALGFFIVGSGFYSSNIKSLFGKLYLNKIKLIDSGFTIFQTAISLGAFLGTIVVVELGMVNYIYGFILAGVLFVLSAALCYYIKENLTLLDQIKDQIDALKAKPRLIYILSSIAILTVFRILYDVTYQVGTNFQNILFDLIEDPYKIFIIALPGIITLLIAIILCVLWAKYYLDHFIKLGIGFIFVGLTYLLIPFSPDSLAPNNFSVIFLSVLLINIGEIIIWPSIYSAITKYSNPKYLATMFGVISIPSFLISGMVSGLFYLIDDNSLVRMIIGSTVSLIVVILLMIYRKKYKNNYLQ